MQAETQTTISRRAVRTTKASPPAILWAEPERLAAGELRSVNAQVGYLLREALARRGLSRGKTALPKGKRSR